MSCAGSAAASCVADQVPLLPSSDCTRVASEPPPPAETARRANSTSSIYVQSTITKPDIEELIFCLAIVIHDRILQACAHVKPTDSFHTRLVLACTFPACSISNQLSPALRCQCPLSCAISRGSTCLLCQSRTTFQRRTTQSMSSLNQTRTMTRRRRSASRHQRHAPPSEQFNEAHTSPHFMSFFITRCDPCISVHVRALA